MSIFILIALLITIISLFMLVRPLLKPKSTLAFKREAQNIHYAKERITELEQQLKNATITATDYEALKSEIESTLASDIDLTSSNTAQFESDKSISSAQSNRVIIILLCTLLPLLSLILYQMTGSPQAINISHSSNAAPTQEDIDAMVLAIEERLKTDPQDEQGWRILARTYLAMGRYQDSINANTKLLELIGEDANIYAQLADAAALLDEGNLAGAAAQYIQKSLAINPNEPHALWLAGLAAAQRGDRTNAISYWNTLLPLLANSPKQQQELTEIIAQTKLQPGNNAQVDSNNSGSDSSASQNTIETTPAVSLTVDISIAEELKTNAQANETVFVFVKARNGPPAPLAVKPLLVADLPARIMLSDENAMMQSLKMSLFEDVVVSVRIAKSGNPVAQPGDIQSKLIETKNNNTEIIQLEISEVIK